MYPAELNVTVRMHNQEKTGIDSMLWNWMIHMKMEFCYRAGWKCFAKQEMLKVVSCDNEVL